LTAVFVLESALTESKYSSFATLFKYAAGWRADTPFVLARIDCFAGLEECFYYFIVASKGCPEKRSTLGLIGLVYF
jgi:hypothetical protein